MVRFDPHLFPKWLYPGSLAIPNGGEPRQVTKLLNMMAPLVEEEDKILSFGKLADSDRVGQR